MTSAHDRRSRVLRDLHFDWTQDPEVVLSERWKAIDLETDYLKTDSELFEGYCRKLYLGLEVKYHQLLDLVVSAHFRWQNKYDYSTTVKGLECSRETGGWKMLNTKKFFCLDKFIINKKQIFE